MTSAGKVNPRRRLASLSTFSKLALTSCVLFAAVSAFHNLARGEVPRPSAFVIVLAGFAVFALAKASVIRRGMLVSFGTQRLSENESNAYRLGYWLMAVGVLVTFA